MNDVSIFPDKVVLPSDKDLIEKLGTTHKQWTQIQGYVLDKYPTGLSEWSFPGKKYGWSFHIKDKKRAIIYFLPRDNYFKVAFVFGLKAVQAVLNSDINEEIRIELEQATKYAEGRGIRIEVKDERNTEDIKKLVDIKMTH